MIELSFAQCAEACRRVAEHRKAEGMHYSSNYYIQLAVRWEELSRNRRELTQRQVSDIAVRIYSDMATLLVGVEDDVLMIAGNPSDWLRQ